MMRREKPVFLSSTFSPFPFSSHDLIIPSSHHLIILIAYD